MSSQQDSCRAGPEESITTKVDLFGMLIQSNNMLSSKYVAVKNSPSYRQCRSALVSSKQDSGRAGPEKGVLYKHKSMILSDMLIQSYNMLPIY